MLTHICDIIYFIYWFTSTLFRELVSFLFWYFKFATVHTCTRLWNLLPELGELLPLNQTGRTMMKWWHGLQQCMENRTVTFRNWCAILMGVLTVKAFEYWMFSDYEHSDWRSCTVPVQFLCLSKAPTYRQTFSSRLCLFFLFHNHCISLRVILTLSTLLTPSE